MAGTRRAGGSSIGELIDVVRARTILADTFAIVSGRSKIQTRAIADAVIEAARLHGFALSRVEGYADGSWILIDLGNVIVHVFTPEQRAFYNLERLWAPFDSAQGDKAQRAQSS
jgi:ribosome-associated protein